MSDVIYEIEDIVSRGNGVTVIISSPSLNEPVYVCFNISQFNSMTDRELEMQVEGIMKERINSVEQKDIIEQRGRNLKNSINTKIQARKQSLLK